MRLHRLEIQAIGPFAERETIDFADLDQAGLFLLDGPTGAGKSTVLASICYALYGSVPGQRKLDSLHSTLAAPGTRPEVLLEVTVSQRRFEILRWPAHQRPAKRKRTGSDGTTTEQAGVHLREWVDGDWIERSRRNDETGHLLSEVLGLTAEQFMRVVLLPQGEFAAFLNAGSKDRETLLRKLFDTQRFDAVEEWLREQARAHGEKVQRDSETLDEIRQRLRVAVAELINDEGDTTDGGESDDAAAPQAEAALHVEALTDDALLEQVESALRLSVDLAEAAQVQAKQRSTAARQRLDALTTRRRTQQAAQAWQHRQQRHLESNEAVDQCRQRLQRHTAAQKVLEAAAAAQRATEQRKHLQESTNDLNQRLDATPEVMAWNPDTSTEQSPTSRWREALAAGYRQQQRLEQARTDQQKLLRLRSRSETVRKDIEAREAGCEKTQESMTALTSERQQHEEHLEKLDAASVSLEHLREEKNRADDIAQAARRAAAEATKLTEKEEQLRAVIDRAQAATQTWQDLVQQRLDRAASLLAVELMDDQPCAVCGSPEHPAPASTAELEQISPEKLQEAEGLRDAALRERTTAEEAVGTVRARRDTAQAQAGGLSVAQADAQVVTVQEKITAAEATQRQRREIDELRQHVVQKIESAQARLTADREKLAGERSTLEALTEETTALANQVTPEDQQLTDDDWQSRQSAVADRIAEIEGLIEALQQLEHARETEDESRRRLEAQLSAGIDPEDSDSQGFDDVDQARAAALTTQEATADQQQLEAWRNEAAALAELAEQPDVVAGRASLERDEPAPTDEDLAQAATTLEVAEHELSEAATELGSVRTTRDQHREEMDRMRGIVERSADQLARFREIDELLKLVRGEGENSYKMRLGSYVLAGRLEKVALAASERLAGMTQGRYTIEHDDTAVSGRRAGLDLRIRDHVNDTLRHPSTLSGGEGFMASLALALGLADTVQAEAGGITMDTLFVDEGFGSLDAQTLEQVMEVLDGLQASGRTIGLVSHVEAMKHQIAHRVEVSLTGGGSHLTVVGPPLA
ncbi:AAA family ATPase [Citricoccus muralis]|uniref:Nuclease SbcCD subunit C n=1 Tax=Citricoccus muralis TaxID=169134 RepID=A0ABY8H988_9MICC|nr:SMC family ATPase [Citricoccus muralis]WFP17715.1 SMC family ATPase [Citricoccus muralis]